MFEISWSELLILAVVVLIFVGPKDLPVFFNTLGKYMGALRRQANEFKRHFDDAMREAEMDNLRKELDGMREEFAKSTSEAERAVSDTIKSADTAVKSAQSATEMPALNPPPEKRELPAPDPAVAAEPAALPKPGA